MAECFKCKNQLAFYGPYAICYCMDCQQNFCENEGDILDKNKIVEVARGKNDRIIYDFRCYDCKEKEEVRKEVLKGQNERLAKQQEERERTDMLKAQRLHSSDNWEAEYLELEKLPEIGTITNMEKEPQGVVGPCSVYVELYGNKWPSKNEKIYLIFTHYKKIDGRLLFERTEHYCLLCAKRFWMSGLRGLEWSFLARRRDQTFKEKFPNIDIKKDYH